MIQFNNITQLREDIFRNGLDQFIVVKIGHKDVRMYPHAEKRMRELAEICDVPFTYAWYRDVSEDGSFSNHPTID